MEGWKIRLEGWKVRRLENWKAGKAAFLYSNVVEDDNDDDDDDIKIERLEGCIRLA